ncbi:cytochrome P450 81E8-like [Arachis duranensis]|uniref:Cytochrome P450 81E8-like n=1 Tax=Arachis duranensis TaxID=130453 RepID=A0A6P4DC41_ARADU|nr:cytochrome P450 81E8-like [Arachis duranensis]
MYTFFLYLSLITISFLLTLKLLFKSRALKNLPPGPPYLPLIGNLHQLKQPFHRAFYELSRKYGKVFSLWFGSRLVVVVSSQTAAQECFSKNDIVLANRPHFLTGKYIGYNDTTLALAPYGDHWRNLRRIATVEVLSTHRITTFLEIRRDEIMRLVQKLARESSNGFNRVELRSKFSEMTFNTMMRMISGKRYYGEDCDVTDVEEARQFRAIIKELVALGGANNPGDFISVLRWFDFDGLENKLKRLSKTTDSFLQGLIDEHRSRKINTNTMIDHLLTQQQSHPEYYTDQIIKGLILVMLLAGTDTSSVTLEWAMSNLLNHPEIIKKARKEIDREIGQDRLIDEPDVSKLNYLQNIVNETLRLNPAAPLLVPHLSSEDFTLEGYKVPKDTMVLVNAWAIHRDPKVWGDDATQFKPERFEKQGEENKLIAFGIGRRACPGANLAQRTVNLALGLLIQCFEWERTTHEEIDMVEWKGQVVSKKIPLEAICKVRDPFAAKNII